MNSSAHFTLFSCFLFLTTTSTAALFDKITIDNVEKDDTSSEKSVYYEVSQGNYTARLIIKNDKKILFSASFCKEKDFSGESLKILKEEDFPELSEVKKLLHNAWQREGSKTLWKQQPSDFSDVVFYEKQQDQ